LQTIQRMKLTTCFFLVSYYTKVVFRNTLKHSQKENLQRETKEDIMVVEQTFTATLCEDCPCFRREYEAESLCSLGYTVGNVNDIFQTNNFSTDCGLRSVTYSKGKYRQNIKSITITVVISNENQPS
jgi:hypothetical protein